MEIKIITPAPARARNGNRVTALRYARILRRSGHGVSVKHYYDESPCDLMIALHARRSFDSIKKFRERHPKLPLIVVMTGTDLYRDIKVNSDARQSLEMATRIVILQRLGLAELPGRLHAKTRIIYQSVDKIRSRAKPATQDFNICVIGNLRPEKDPFRTAMAVRLLPASSRVKVIQVGRALGERMEKFALEEPDRNPRYRWLGELPYRETRRLLAGSDLLSLTSRMEGSSNALCEALASGVPVVASKIAGLVGTLGEDYPGYFPVGNTRALTRLLRRAETDSAFYDSLKSHCASLTPLVAPDRERDCWERLLKELA